jgi:ribosome biogenesis protein ENP2
MSAMKVATFNGTKVYNLTSDKSIPNWLSENKKRALAKDEDYRKRLELIQDFEMPTACGGVKMSKDGEHIIVSGTYPPSIKCYTVSDLSMKFHRGLTCEVVAFEMLSDDFGKLVFLQADRTVSFHAPYGTHYNLRIPKFGRHLAYNWETCDLFVAASGDEIYRINLETGQFNAPLALGFAGCNKVHINPVHQLLACGGESPVCEFWDTRSRSLAARLIVESKENVSEIYEVKFDIDGLTLGVGTSNGQCILYDIRSSKPLYCKEHQYGYPVFDINFHNDSKHVISTDRKIVKIWERSGDSFGKILANIETPVDINSTHIVSDQRGQSGLIMIAGEQSKIMTYFVPQLGPAPRWCSFLESLTEELEETAGENAFEDYKFLTKAEVDDLGATSLIGTPMLKGYMHGFFMEMKMYSKLRAVSKPFEYEEYMKKKIREKIDEKREKRIIPQKRIPKINKELAEKFAKTKGGQIVDERFSGLFEREEFQQDEESFDYKLRNPSKGMNVRKVGTGDDSDDDLQGVFDYVGNEDKEDSNPSDGSDDDDVGVVNSFKKRRPKTASDDEDDGQIARASQKVPSNRNSKMYELSAGISASKVIFKHTADEKNKFKEHKSKTSITLLDRIQVENRMNSSTKFTTKRSIRESTYIPKEADSQKHVIAGKSTDERIDAKNFRHKND